MAGSAACGTGGAEGKEEEAGEVDKGLGRNSRQAIKSGEEEV